MTKSTAGLQAKALLDWLQDRVGDGGEIAFRDVLRFGPSATRRLDAAEAALKTLARHGRTEEVSSRPRRIRVWASRERRTLSGDRNEACDAATVATVPGTKAETVASAASAAAPQASQPENSASGAPTVATVAVSREKTAISASGPAAWREALLALSPDHDPCPGFQSGAWARVWANALDFVEKHGDKAAALGWTAEELFGVHPVIGVMRPDCCGALMLSRGVRVVQVRAEEIRYANRLAFRRNGKPRSSVPVWGFRHGGG